MAERPPTPRWMRPLWTRALLILIPAVWAAVEAYHGDSMWATLFGVVAVSGFWSLIVKFDEAEPPPPSSPPPSPPESKP
jgi:4-hydroxybenzoate polyprenyltransferase